MSKKTSIKSKLPKEALLFAKSMGLNLDGLEPEAEDIWKMLDDLSNKDPIQYQEFVSQQFQNQKETNDQSDDNKRSFRPKAGFSIETSTIDGDGLKIREIEGSNKVMGKKLYINLCSSIVIEAPIDKFGRPVLESTSAIDGLSIPLVVGTVRENSKHVLAIDVVFHPNVIELANKEKYFKKQISDLALDWVIQESGLKCDTSWEYCNKDAVLYHCGRGENKDSPVLFFVAVDTKGEPTVNNNSKGNDTILTNTSTLLSEINKDRNTSTNIQDVNESIKIAKPIKKPPHGVHINNTNNNNTNKMSDMKPKVLIQELDGDGCSIINREDVDTSKTMMNSKETNEDMSKTLNNVHTQNNKTIQDKNHHTSNIESTNKENLVKLPSKKEYADMEKLLTNFDDEFSNSLGAMDQSTYMQTESANTMIADLAKILTGVSKPGSIPVTINTNNTNNTTTTNNNNQDKYREETAVAQNIMKHLCIKNDSNSTIDLSLKVEQSTLNPHRSVLIITLSGFCSSLDTSLIELLVSPKEALIKIPKKYISLTSNNVHDNVIFGANYTGTLCSFNVLNTSASFKKKKGILQIKINLNIN